MAKKITLNTFRRYAHAEERMLVGSMPKTASQDMHWLLPAYPRTSVATAKTLTLPRAFATKLGVR